MKTNNLSYNVTKFYVENGITYKMNVRISTKLPENITFKLK